MRASKISKLRGCCCHGLGAEEAQSSCRFCSWVSCWFSSWTFGLPCLHLQDLQGHFYLQSPLPLINSWKWRKWPILAARSTGWRETGDWCSDWCSCRWLWEFQLRRWQLTTGGLETGLSLEHWMLWFQDTVWHSLTKWSEPKVEESDIGQTIGCVLFGPGLSFSYCRLPGWVEVSIGLALWMNLAT